MLTLSRAEFADEYWDYRPGESAVWICPTGAGKTWFMYQCVDAAMRQHPRLRVTSALPKPADETTYEWAGRLRFRVKDEYPFSRPFWKSKPRGYVLHPPHIRDDEDKNEEHLHGQFKRLLSGEYWAGDCITCVDDAYRIVCGLKLGKYTDKYLCEGRSNGAGLFGTLQQPRGTVTGGAVSSFWYSQPTHMFLGKDGNAQNRERFSEIACGLDPKMISDIVTNLRTYRMGDSGLSDMLYLNRTGPYLAIIRPF